MLFLSCSLNVNSPSMIEDNSAVTGDTSFPNRELVALATPEPVSLGEPFLYPPLAEPKNTPNWFNHAPDPLLFPGKALVFTGELIASDPNHYAYDWITDIGTPVYAAADGLVISAYDGEDYCPKMNPKVRPAKSIKILHQDTSPGVHYSTQYLHLDSLSVSKNDTVTKGQLIGTSGNTGCSNLAHLHFAVRRVVNLETNNGFMVDPFGWVGSISDPKYVDSVNLWITPPVLLRSGEVVSY